MDVIEESAPVETPVETPVEPVAPAPKRISLDLLGALTAAAIALASIIRLLRDSGKGIDLTDEGMYLWSADPPNPTDLFHAPYGRYTGMLYRLVGWDIARFRAVGVLVLFAVAALLGRTVVAVALRLAGRPASRALDALGAAAIAGAATTGYTLYLLTPNYNWINLLGLMLSAAAGLSLAVPGRPGSWRDRAAWPAAAAIGAFLSMTGKPSSGPVILALTALVVIAVRSGSLRSRFVPLFAIAGATAIVWAFHFVFVNSPSDTLDMYRRGLDALRILDPASYEISNAVASVRRAIADAPGLVLSNTNGLVLLALAAVALLFRRTGASGSTARSLTLVVLPGVAVSLALRNLWIGGSAGYIVLATVGVSLLACTIPLAAITRALDRRDGLAAASPWWRAASLTTYLAAFGAAYAFGSGNGFYIQLNGGVALLVAATFLLLVTFVEFDPGRPVAIAVAIAVTLGGLHLVDSARQSPYRTFPMDQQTVEHSVGPHGSVLRLDPQTAAYLDELRGATYGAGFTPGTPMLDFTYYSATALYDLDALVPHSLIPTVGAYVATNDLARWSIEQLEVPVWRDAWLLTAPQNPAAPDPSSVSILGRTFPDDYELVGEIRWWQRDELQQVWRPAD